MHRGDGGLCRRAPLGAEVVRPWAPGAVDRTSLRSLYIEEVCQDLDASATNLTLLIETQEGIDVKGDSAMSIALIIVELITNCAKCTYPAHAGGKVWVSLARNGDRTTFIAVRDEGAGLPEGFSPRRTRGLGMWIVQAFSTQLNTKLDFDSRSPDTDVTLLFSLNGL